MKKEKTVNIKEIFLGLQTQMSSKLTVNKNIISHPVAKGDVTELEWVAMLNTYLPTRYQVEKAFVIDHKGNISEQIDIVIFDRHFSPFLMRQNGCTYIPAESVYAVIEVKPVLNLPNIRYAANKATSVRRLVRTNQKIVQASGVIEQPKKPFDIIAGILTTDGSLNHSILNFLKDQKENQRIHFGCSLNSGSFFFKYKDSNLDIEKSNVEKSLIFFLLGLVDLLQNLGSVPAINLKRYMEAIR